MKYFKVIILSFLTLFSSYSYADPDELAELVAIYGVVNQSLSQLQAQVNELKGNFGLGNLNNQDFGSWKDASSWKDALNVAENGGNGGGKLGSVVSSMANQFPINTNAFNQADSSKIDQTFYDLQSKTALAARAASQLDYDNLQGQIDYQKNLQKQIDSTSNVKAALDLNNRLQVENNLIHLQMLRQVSLLNQQQSLKAQEEINATNKNLQFLK